MPDATVCDGQTGARVLKNLAYLTHPSAVDNLSIAIIDGHPSAFLPSMLKKMPLPPPGKIVLPGRA